jgi:hypothetical protein
LPQIHNMLKKQLEEYPNRKCQEITFSLPKEIIKKNDADRGDVSKSRYVLRLIQTAFGYQVSAEEGDRSNK